MGLLKLIRLPNLLIVILTQFLLYQLLLQQFSFGEITPSLDYSHFSYLVFVTVLITAAGYIVNDILDLPTDMINRPNQVIIGRRINKSTAYWLYFSCFLVGFIVSLYLAYHVQKMPLLSLFPLSFIGLYLYSTTFKKRPLIGNLLIALYCAGVAAILLVAEQEGIRELVSRYPNQANYLRLIFYFYIIFAFLSTMFREIVKDIEDLEGDQQSGCRTAPIAWGIKISKSIAGVFGVLLLVFVPLMIRQIPALNEQMSTWVFVILFILLPLLIALYLLIVSKDKKAYHRLSQLAKFIMLSGILFLVFILYL